MTGLSWFEGMTDRKARARAKAGGLLWFPTLDPTAGSRMGHPRLWMGWEGKS